MIEKSQRGRPTGRPLSFYVGSLFRDVLKTLDDGLPDGNPREIQSQHNYRYYRRTNEVAPITAGIGRHKSGQHDGFGDRRQNDRICLQCRQKPINSLQQSDVSEPIPFEEKASADDSRDRQRENERPDRQQSFGISCWIRRRMASQPAIATVKTKPAWAKQINLVRENRKFNFAMVSLSIPVIGYFCSGVLGTVVGCGVACRCEITVVNACGILHHAFQRNF